MEFNESAHSQAIPPEVLQAVSTSILLQKSCIIRPVLWSVKCFVTLAAEESYY